MFLKGTEFECVIHYYYLRLSRFLGCLLYLKMASLSNCSTNGHFEDQTKRLNIIDERFECPICLSCLKEPFLTSCGHRFCQDCIHQWLKKEGSCCPIDGTILSLDQDLFPDNYTRREIAQQKIECPFPECAKKVPLLETERHIADAHEKTLSYLNGDAIHCPFQNIGCHFLFKTPSQMMSHTETYLSHHLQLLMNSHNGLSFKFEKSWVDGKAAESEMWTPPPKTEAEIDERPDFQSLIKTLYERLVLVEQASREQQILLANLTEKVNRLTEENSRLRTELPRRICGGVHVWRVAGLTQKLSAMSKDPSLMYYSEDFYTSYSGYRFCARLNISPNSPDHLSLLVHLMRGENDLSLPWPFTGRIAFTLVHPTSSEASTRDVMCSRPELEAFKRPSRDLAPRGFGYTEFVLIADLITRGFLADDDSVTIKIEIATV